jgi:hypothetical protein
VLQTFEKVLQIVFDIRRRFTYEPRKLSHGHWIIEQQVNELLPEHSR